MIILWGWLAFILPVAIGMARWSFAIDANDQEQIDGEGVAAYVIGSFIVGALWPVLLAYFLLAFAGLPKHRRRVMLAWWKATPNDLANLERDQLISIIVSHRKEKEDDVAKTIKALEKEYAKKPARRR